MSLNYLRRRSAKGRRGRGFHIRRGLKRISVEHLDFVARFGEHQCGEQPGGTASDDDDLHALLTRPKSTLMARVWR